jgi:Fe-S-cluster containining protein
MLLLKEDIEHLKRLGFDYSYFVVDRDGWLQIRNYDGRCVFNDGKKCLIYEYRPEGCKLYPIIYDEEKNRAALDEDCPHRDEFTSLKGEMAISLYAKLMEERRRRSLWNELRDTT